VKSASNTPTDTTLPQEPPRGVTAGLDWARDDHAVSVVDDRGRELDRATVPHSAPGLRELIDKKFCHCSSFGSAGYIFAFPVSVLQQRRRSRDESVPLSSMTAIHCRGAVQEPMPRESSAFLPTLHPLSRRGGKSASRLPRAARPPLPGVRRQPVRCGAKKTVRKQVWRHHGASRQAFWRAARMGGRSSRVRG
jgi:hypothetical protein